MEPINAKKAKNITCSKYADIKFEEYNEQIFEAINNGRNAIITNTLSKEIAITIADYYRALEYEVEILRNNCVAIGW